VAKIAVISDIHGNILALEAVAADIERRRITTILNLGDHLSGPLWPKETIGYLMDREWITIRGNHDRRLVEAEPQALRPSDHYAFKFLNDSEKGWLRSLPSTIELDNGLFLFHGTPSSDTEYLLETVENGRERLATPSEIKQRLGDVEGSLLLCGHTHIPRVVYLGDKRMIINPGSVGLPAYNDDFPEFHVVESGSPHAKYAVLENHGGSWIVDLISVPYNHFKAAEQAKKNNRPDWEIALRTGFMVE
jgi:predicted phosphodiesterase